MNKSSKYYYYDIAAKKIEYSINMEEFILNLIQHPNRLLTNNELKSMKLDLDYNEKLKRAISKHTSRIPLYDIKSNHIFLIYYENVYPRIFYDNYRFVDEYLYDQLKSKKDLDEFDKENLRILSMYNLSILHKTYMQLFYDSFILNNYLTSCRRPSFSSGLEHIMPYYNTKELNYLAYDWKVKSPSASVDESTNSNHSNSSLLTQNMSYIKSDIDAVCKIISKYDISSKTLVEHQLYIFNSNAIGLVKHYSLFGSYYMNMWLRKTQCMIKCVKDYIENSYLENQINIMTKFIIGAPAFEQSHTVYRFVETDDWLQHLTIGDIYVDSAFISTTRNPFYFKENYMFGYILIKIKIPADVIGIGLSIESYSNFPAEEEIILPPTSSMRLDNIIETVTNTEFHDTFDLLVKKKYEFTLIGNSFINGESIPKSIPIIPEISTINLQSVVSELAQERSISVSNRFNIFRTKYVNINNQFKSVVNGITYTFNIESYNSSNVYKNFFYYETSDGIMITTSNPKYGNINLLIEIGCDLHINWYFRYSLNDSSAVVDLDQPKWIEWLALFAYIIGSRNVIIHSNYKPQYIETDDIDQKILKTRYPVSENIYNYMKHGKMMYVYPEINPQFDYYDIDYLKGIKIFNVIKSTDKNELYRVATASNLTTMHEFYLYIVEYYPRLIRIIESKFMEIFENAKNPWLNINYNLDVLMYLFQYNYIKYIPSTEEFCPKQGGFKKIIGDKKIMKFKNRLRFAKFSKK